LKTDYRVEDGEKFVRIEVENAKLEVVKRKAGFSFSASLF
jgi:hypothetical protein